MSGLHAAIIMDGNGRWARRQGKPRWRGHLAGVDSVRDAVRASPDLGITTLTLYAFSADNWKRSMAKSTAKRSISLGLTSPVPTVSFATPRASPSKPNR